MRKQLGEEKRIVCMDGWREAEEMTLKVKASKTEERKERGKGK